MDSCGRSERLLSRTPALLSKSWLCPPGLVPFPSASSGGRSPTFAVASVLRERGQRLGEQGGHWPPQSVHVRCEEHLHL